MKLELSTMLKRLFLALIMLFLTCSIPVVAQSELLTGRVMDVQSRQPMEKATLQLYKVQVKQSGKADTTFVAGALSDERGRFSFTRVGSGSYVLKVSFLGYEKLMKSFSKSGSQSLALGDLQMKSETVEINEAVITANLPKMVIKDDTVVYNADAFRVPEGSVIESLVEMLPGAKVDDNGSVSINGRNVRRFKMDGRDFMTGNNDAVMKNLPSYVVDKVKAYDEKSDLSRMTGVDDGNDDFVLEFVTKRSMRNGLQANPDVGIGTNGRYGVRLTAMKPFGATRYTFMGNANNVNDRNFSGRGGRGRGNRDGQRHAKTAALDVSYENDKNLKVNGRVTWNHNDADNWNRTGSENFVNTRGGAFSNSVNQSYSRTDNWTGDMNLQWNIDRQTTLSFRPNLSFSTNDSRSFSTSASFNVNPFDYVEDPLSNEGLNSMDQQGLIVNGRQNKSSGYSSNKNLRSQLQLYHRFGNKGRNIALTSNFNYRNGKNRNASLSAVHLYLTPDQRGNDSTYQTNRYTLSPSDNLSWSIGATYTEPIYTFKRKNTEQDSLQRTRWPFGGGGSRGSFGGGGRGPFGGGRQMVGQEGIYLQLSYNYSYNHQKSDPSTYDFPEYSSEAFNDVLQQYRDWTRLFGYLDNPYESYLSDALSRYSERTEYNHNVELQLRVNRQKYNLNAGITIQPQRSHFVQQYLGIPVDTVRDVMNVSPTVNLNYRFNQQSNLRLIVRGSSSQPSITQLLDIYDDTNPLSVSMGNPGLKPSFTTNVNLNFMLQRRMDLITDSMGFVVPKASRHWSLNTNASLRRTGNSIGNVVTYNELTGGRISRPENINGNWGGNLGVMFNVALDTLNRWDVSGAVQGSYDHHVGYVNLNRTAIPDRNVTHTYNLSPNVSLSYRNSWLNVSFNGSATYAHTRNRLQASNNLSTWNFSYGSNARVTFPWGTDLSTDLTMYSKRGYSDQTLNTNEFIWNAQLSHSFLRGKKLTVMLQWYDILHQQTNFSRTVNANGWTDREVNSLTTYAMLHISYRMNFFGGGHRGGEWGRPGEWGQGRNFGQGQRGGFGGRGGSGGFGGRRR